MCCCSTCVEPFILGLRRSLKTFGDPLGENLNELLEDPSNVGNGRLVRESLLPRVEPPHLSNTH